MAIRLSAALALLAFAVAPEAGAQMKEQPPRDAGVSVVIRCKDCGVLESIREVQDTRSTTPSAAPSATASPGATATSSGSPIGLVMYIPVGRNLPNNSAYVGSVGTRQWQERTAATHYEFIVRMDDGGYRFLPRQGVSDFAAGDRVKVSEGQIEHFTQ